ncbi:MAG: EamA family transporter [Acidobacteria bacterium]|nr:EamA family transporter [Acidobacteriota bacterium]MCW5948811.1 EamA family transporter [Pyrinomonadaceae bacterium]
MERWMAYALLSMFFAGVTSVLAKYGLEDINSDLALAIRTLTILVLVIGFVAATKKYDDLSVVTWKQTGLLVASGLATTLSWVFYYRAMKEGLVSWVASIDKASIVVTLVLSFVLLGEPITKTVLIGGGLILAGLVVLVFK